MSASGQQNKAIFVPTLSAISLYLEALRRFQQVSWLTKLQNASAAEGSLLMLSSLARMHNGYDPLLFAYSDRIAQDSHLIPYSPDLHPTDGCSGTETFSYD